MSFLFIYLFKLSVTLAVVFVFYHFVLRKLTFYNWNRWYLLGYSFLSFFIALINIGPVLEQQEWSQSSIVQWVPVIQATDATGPIAPVTHSLSFSQWIILLILAGSALMFIRLLIQFFSFRKMIRNATPIAVETLAGSSMKLYQVNENIMPFSFGNSIFINQHLHSRDELQEIVWHEFIHVKQKHSFDIMGGEILCLLNWYNPFAWLLRHAIRQNLEFIADNKVLENGIDRKEYQYLLLKVIGNNHFSIAPKFNFSSLKKRIAMMNKMKSAGVHIVKFLFILPLIAVLLVAFRNKYDTFQSPPIRENIGRDTIPQVKLPDEIESMNLSLVKNDPIETDPVNQKLSGIVTVKRKDGKKEVYDLKSDESRSAFEKKYGVKLEDLVPPPPTPPVLPANAIPSVPPVPPVPPSKNNEGLTLTSPVPGGVSQLAAPVPNGMSQESTNLSRMSSEFEITNKKAWIKLKDGTVENYDLTNSKERDAFEKKYGQIINLNLNTNVNTVVSPRVSTTLKTNVTSSVNTNVSTTVRATVTPAPVDDAVTVIAAPGLSNGVSTVIAPAVVRTTDVRGTTPRPAAIASGAVPAVIDDYGYVITGKEDIIVTITKNTTREELEKFKLQMKEKGVTLSFDDIDYNAKGKLVNITGTMKMEDNRSKFVANDFETLILAMIKDGDRIYFKVSIKDKEVI